MDENLHLRPGLPQSRDDGLEQLHDAMGGADVAASQPHAQQQAGGPLEDEVGQVHVLAVEAVEQGQLLMAVAGVVGGVDVQDQPVGRLAGHALEEHLHQQAVDLGDLTGSGGVLEAAEGGLAAEGPGLVGRDGLQDGVVPQAGVVVGVLVAGDQREEPLADEGRQVMGDLAALPDIVEHVGDGGRPPETLVELAQGQQAGVRCDEPAVKIGDDGLSAVEVEGKLFSTVCHAKASLPCGVASFEHPHSTRLRRPLLCADRQESRIMWARQLLIHPL